MVTKEWVKSPLWKHDKHLCSLRQEQYDLLSLDVFDTILFRACSHPTDVFLEVGKRGKEKGFLKESITPKEFQQIRILAEKKARQLMKKEQGHDEVTLQHIYDHFPPLISHLEQLMELEIQVEEEYCYVNPSMLSFVSEFAQLGKPIILVSDMYLSSAQIIRLLKKNHFPIEYIERIYVSSEHRCGKYNGKLFEVVIRDYGYIMPHKILHIGDNRQADVLWSAKCGISNLHYNVIPQTFNDIFEWECIRYGHHILPEILSLRKLAGSLCPYDKKDEQFWFKLGAQVLGPFFTLFADWVILMSKREKKKGVYAFMREGKILKELLKRSAQYHQYDVDIKELYVSRQASYLPSLEKLDKGTIEKLFERRNLTVKDIFRMFCLLDEQHSFTPYFSVDVSELVEILLPSGTSLKVALIDYLLSDAVQQKVNSLIQEKRHMFIQYIRQEMCSLQDVVTVDLGFQGTIQKSLERALYLYGERPRITHVLGMGAETNKFHLANGMDIRGFVGNAGENHVFIRTIMRSPEGIEQLLMAAGGSTVGYTYDRESEKVKPVLDKKEETFTELKVKDVCQQGIYFFQQLWFYFSDCSPSIAGNLLNRKEELVKLLHRFVDFPTLAEAVNVGDLSHDDNFGSQSSSKICTEENEQFAEEIGISQFLYLSALSYKRGRVYWPQAVVTRKEPSYLFQQYVMLNDSSGYSNAMIRLASEVANEGNKKIILYGGGEVGQAFMNIVHLFHLNVDCIVDRNEAMWGQKLNGVEIVSLDEAVKRGIHVYVVASFSFAEDISRDIQERYKKEGCQPKIYTPY